MGATYVNLTTHIVFSTKNRVPTIDAAWRSDLHAYAGGTVRGLGGIPLAVGGTADHVHVLADVKATRAVADFVRELKKATSLWSADRHAGFRWQAGYAAISVTPAASFGVADYVGRQEQHHRRVSSADELRSLLEDAGIPIDERYFE